MGLVFDRESITLRHSSKCSCNCPATITSEFLRGNSFVWREIPLPKMSSKFGCSWAGGRVSRPSNVVHRGEHRFEWNADCGPNDALNWQSWISKPSDSIPYKEENDKMLKSLDGQDWWTMAQPPTHAKNKSPLGQNAPGERFYFPIVTFACSEAVFIFWQSLKKWSEPPQEWHW